MTWLPTRLRGVLAKGVAGSASADRPDFGEWYDYTTMSDARSYTPDRIGSPVLVSEDREATKTGLGAIRLIPSHRLA